MRRLILILLMLLTLPSFADSWFTDSVVVLQVERGDVYDIRGLLGTLVPELRYEVRGQCIVAEGPFGSVRQVQEFFAELDEPLRLVIKVTGLEFSPQSGETIRTSWRQLELDEDPRTSSDLALGVWELPISGYLGDGIERLGNVKRLSQSNIEVNQATELGLSRISEFSLV